VLETVIHNFGAGTDATQPLGTVVFDKNGNLYGAAEHGARSGCNGGCGAIYQLRPNSGNWTETILHRFTGGVDGGSPYGTPVLSTMGLFGIATVGGAHNYGLVFELTP
jgi:hypothetical protein